MKKYIYLFCSLCLYISPMNTLGADDDDDNVTPNSLESGGAPAEQIMAAELLLDEIETVQKQLDKLTSTGRLSSSAALTASGLLATLAYGSLRIVRYCYVQNNWNLEGQWLNAFKVAFNESIFPALGIGGLIGYNNYFDEELPALSHKDSLKLGIQTFITGLGLSLILSNNTTNTDYPNVFWQTGMFFNIIANGIAAYRMYVYMLKTRKQKQDDIFNLQNRLQDARKELDELKHSI